MAARYRATLVLCIAFGVATAAFLASTAYSQLVASRIDVSARSIYENATRAVNQLTWARTDIRELEALVAKYAERPTPEARATIESRQSRIDQSFQAYLALEPYPGERDLWPELHSRVSAFDHAVARAMAAAESAVGREARKDSAAELARAATATIQSITEAIEFNAKASGDLAQSITQQRRHATAVAIVLDVFSLCITCALVWFTVRAARRYETTVAARRRESEERAEELEKFAGRVAHDIRGPLSAVSLAFSLLERKHAADPATANVVARGRNAINRTEKILTGLLGFARAGARPGPNESTDITILLEETIASLTPIAEEAQIELVSHGGPHRLVAANAGVLMSVVENLIRNAVKYMDGPQRRIEVRVLERDRFARVEVEDTGPGIPAALLPRLFDPHVRGHSGGGGIGIGLATVRKIVEAHGGSVGVRPAPVRGSIFWFELPVVESPAEETTALH